MTYSHRPHPDTQPRLGRKRGLSGEVPEQNVAAEGRYMYATARMLGGLACTFLTHAPVMFAHAFTHRVQVVFALVLTHAQSFIAVFAHETRACAKW